MTITHTAPPPLRSSASTCQVVSENFPQQKLVLFKHTYTHRQVCSYVRVLYTVIGNDHDHQVHVAKSRFNAIEKKENKHREADTDRETDRDIDRQLERLTDRQTDS